MTRGVSLYLYDHQCLTRKVKVLLESSMKLLALMAPWRRFEKHYTR